MKTCEVCKDFKRWKQYFLNLNKNTKELHGFSFRSCLRANLFYFVFRLYLFTDWFVFIKILKMYNGIIYET